MTGRGGRRRGPGASDPRREVQRALALHDDVDCADALMKAIGASDDERYDRLPPILKAVVVAMSFTLERNSGGIYQVVANSSSSVLEDMRQGLGLIGAGHAQRLLDDVRGRFPEGAFPEDENDKADALDDFDAANGGRQLAKLDKAYEATGEDVLRLLRTYVAGHEDEVVAALGRTREPPTSGRR